MRREEIYLRDIVEAANHIAGFIAGFDPPGFQESELVQVEPPQGPGYIRAGGCCAGYRVRASILEAH